MKKNNEIKMMINNILSIIATKHESDIQSICKDANIYYPPKWYKSIRGSRQYDELFYLCNIDEEPG